MTWLLLMASIWFAANGFASVVADKTTRRLRGRPIRLPQEPRSLRQELLGILAGMFIAALIGGMVFGAISLIAHS